MTTLTYRNPKREHLFAYALIVPDRDPFYLPTSLKPQGIGYARNLSLSQSPHTESPYVIGDGMRKITPLILSGSVDLEFFSIPTEEAVRLYLSELDTLTQRAIGVQRASSVHRALFPFGYLTAIPTGLFDWTLTLTLMPSGPTWIDTTTGIETPF